MDQHATETGLPLQGDVRSLENSLKALWDRARKTAELIVQLREEKSALTARVAELEQEIQHLRQELHKKESARNSGGESTASGPRGSALFANGEREALLGKLKDLLAKLDAYL